MTNSQGTWLLATVHSDDSWHCLGFPLGAEGSRTESSRQISGADHAAHVVGSFAALSFCWIPTGATAPRFNPQLAETRFWWRFGSASRDFQGDIGVLAAILGLQAQWKSHCHPNSLRTCGLASFTLDKVFLRSQQVDHWQVGLPSLRALFHLWRKYYLRAGCISCTVSVQYRPQVGEWYIPQRSLNLYRSSKSTTV